MAIISGSSLSLTDTVDTNDVFDLFEVRATATANIGGQTFVYAANDTSVSVFTLDDLGQLSFLTSYADIAAIPLEDNRDLEAFTVAGNHFLAVNSYEDDGVTIFSLSASGAYIQLSDTIFDSENGSYRLGGPWSMSTFETGSAAVVYSAGYSDSGLAILNVNSTGTITNQVMIADDGTNSLRSAWLSDVAEAPSGFAYNDLLVTASFFDDSITVWSVASDGSLTEQATFSDANLLDGASGPSALALGDDLFIYLPLFNRDGLAVIKFDGTDFEIVQEIISGVDLEGAVGTDLMTVGDKSFLTLSTYQSDTFSMFEINNSVFDPNPGLLSLVDLIQDNEGRGALHRNQISTHATVDGKDFVIVASEDDDAVNVYELGGGDDVLDGTQSGDEILGHGGDDIITALAGDDLIDGGRGTDIIYAGSGLDTVVASIGNDRSYGGAGYDRLDMTLFNGEANGVMVDLNNDRAILPGGARQFVTDFERIDGTAQNDTLTGDEDNNDLRGNNGDDSLRGREGNDFLRGGAGEDFLVGADGDDYLSGGAGNDVNLNGGEGQDTLLGEAGDDSLYGGLGNDTMLGGDDNDLMRGNEGNDTLDGGSGADDLRGGDGNDIIFSVDGANYMAGDAGNDVLFSGADNDTMAGGAGDDEFVFTQTVNDGGGFNSVTDFTNGEDSVDVSDYGFASATDVINLAVSKSWGVRIDFADGQTIALEGVSLGDLDASDFIL